MDIELRCGEVTVLEWNDATELEMALLVTIRSSKTDKEGKGFEFLIPANMEHPEICPLRWFLRFKASFPSPTDEKCLFLCLSLILFLTTLIILAILLPMNTFRTFIMDISRESIYRLSSRKKYNW